MPAALLASFSFLNGTKYATWMKGPRDTVHTVDTVDSVDTVFNPWVYSIFNSSPRLY